MKQKDRIRELLLNGDLANMLEETVRDLEVGTSSQVYSVLKPYIAQFDTGREHFVVLFLDAKNKVIAMEKMFSGTLSSASVYPREVIKRAFALNAAALIIAHNHPSGDPTPSPQDNALTKKLCASCYGVDLTLHEHVVVGQSGYYSYADRGDICRYTTAIRGVF